MGTRTLSEVNCRLGEQLYIACSVLRCRAPDQSYAAGVLNGDDQLVSADSSLHKLAGSPQLTYPTSMMQALPAYADLILPEPSPESRPAEGVAGRHKLGS